MANAKKSSKSVKKTTSSLQKSSSKPAFVESSESTFSIEDTNQPVSKEVNRKRVIVLGLIILGLGLVLFFLYKYLIIGWVDQTPLTRWDMSNQLEAKYGKEYKDQVITETLILNEAKKRNITDTDADINAEVKKIEDQQGGADQLNQALVKQGMTMAELKKELRFQVLIKKMFGNGVTATDDEVNKYIADNKDSITQVTDQVKQQVKDQLVLQKTGQAFNTWLSAAKSSNRVISY